VNVPWCRESGVRGEAGQRRIGACLGRWLESLRALQDTRSTPRAVLVDVGGTLWSQPVLNPVDRDSAEWEVRLVLAGVPEDRVADLCKELNRAIGRAVGAPYFDVWQAIAEAAAHANVTGIEADRIRSASCLPAKDFTHLLPGARALLTFLKARRARVVIASNAIWRTEADYWADFRSFELAGLIDAVVSSVDIRWRKPSKGFFDITLQRAGVPPEGCVMIGIQ
jgi:FMN phosphatase YigB (HAD superfamily)